MASLFSLTTDIGISLCSSMGSGSASLGASILSIPVVVSNDEITFSASQPSGRTYLRLNSRLMKPFLSSFSSCFPWIVTAFPTVLTVSSSGLKWWQSSLTSNLFLSLITSEMPLLSGLSCSLMKLSKSRKSRPKFWWTSLCGQSQTSQ